MNFRFRADEYDMRLNNKFGFRGFSLIEILVVLGILSVVMVGGMQYFEYFSKERARSDALVMIQGVRNKLYTLIEDQVAWEATLNQSTNLKCLLPNSIIPCVGDATEDTKIYDQSGALVYDTTSQGYTKKGLLCMLTNSDCLFQFVVKTKLTCPVGIVSCTSPSVLTTGVLKMVGVNPGFSIVVANYSFESVRGRRSIASMKAEIPFSSDCSTWQSDGWPSIDSCFRDGRWHLVYQNDGGGIAIKGSEVELQSHVNSGADVKIVVVTGSNPYMSGNERCTGLYSLPGNTTSFCISSLRFANHTTPSHGSVRYSTKGEIYCNAITGGGNGCDIQIPINWYIKY